MPLKTAGTLSRVGDEPPGLFMDGGWLAGGIARRALAAWHVEARYGIAAATGSKAVTAGLVFVLAASAIRPARN